MPGGALSEQRVYHTESAPRCGLAVSCHATASAGSGVGEPADPSPSSDADSRLPGRLLGPCSATHVTFSEWWATRPELRSILNRLLRLNPLAALSLHRAPTALAGGEAQETADRRVSGRRP